jgi:photosystem II stability/assembly factor-like uncharacterized protein
MRRIISLFPSLIGIFLVSCASSAPPVESAPTNRPDPVVIRVPPSGAIYNVAEFLDAKKGFAFGNLAGFQAGATMHTADAGETWQSAEMDLPGRTQFCDIHGVDVVDGNLIWAGTDTASVYVSADGGKTWKRVADPGPADRTFTYVSFLDAERGWVGYSAEVFSTLDGGTTWGKLTLPDGVTQVAAIDRTSADEGFLLDGAGLLHRTADGGKTWTAQDPMLGKNVLINAELPNTAMRFPDSRHGVIVTGLTDDGGKVHLLRTSDGGRTWEHSLLPIPLGGFRISNDATILTRAQSLELTIVVLGGL